MMRIHFAKHVAIEVKIATLQLKILHSLIIFRLLVKVIPKTSWLPASTIDCEDERICLEQRSEEIIGDLPISDEFCKAFSGRLVRVLDGAN